MARHTSNRHNKKNSVTILLPVRQENNSRYQLLDYWMSVMVGLLSLVVLLQRFRGAMPAHTASLLPHAVTLPHHNGQPSNEIQFPGLAPLLLSSAVTYQTGNSVVGMLSSILLWFARPVAAQTSGVNIVVPEFRLNSNVTGSQFAPAAACTSTGVWMVVWESGQTPNRDIYAQRYASNGSALGSEFRVNSNVTRDQHSPVIASLSTGELVVVWQGTQAIEDIYAQRYAMNGSVLGSEFRVNSVSAGGNSNPAVASLSNGEWMAVWHGFQTGNADIYAQRYASNGTVLGSEFRVNSNVTRGQYNPAVASTSTGEWMVVWAGYQTGDYNIYAQQYASNGSVLGSEFRVNSNVTGDQSFPAVASTSTGEWVVVWHGAQTGNYDIYAQRYAMDRSMLGSEFRVNSNVTGDQTYPAVASTGTGEWVVVWQSAQIGDYDIYAQRYALNGSALGSEFRVNSNVTGSQWGPRVASLGTGEWVALWSGAQTGNYDIYGSIFSSTGPLTTTASATSSGVTASTMLSTVKSTVTTQASSTSSPLLPTVTGNNSATLSTLATSQAISTSSSTVTTQVSSTSLSTATNDNSVKTATIISSLNAFTSTSSTGVSGTVTTATNQPTNNPTTPQLITATNANSGVSGTVIGAAAGAGGFAVAACLGAMGFYAYRKKSRAGQANPSAVNDVSTSLNTTEDAMSQLPSGYVQMNVKPVNQSDNMIPVSHSPYGQIDEMKRVEKEYDHVPKF